MIEPVNWWKTKLVMFIAQHTPKCHDITRLISVSMDRPLSWRTRVGVRIHYLICVWCERYRDQLALQRKALREMPSRDEQINRTSLPPSARTRLKSTLRAEP